jgi:hypothetical protein
VAKLALFTSCFRRSVAIHGGSSHTIGAPSTTTRWLAPDLPGSCETAFTSAAGTFDKAAFQAGVRHIGEISGTVLRVSFAAREKRVRHEHQLNHIVVYPTGHAESPAGTVKIEAPESI